MREDNYREHKSISVPLDALFEKVASDYDLGKVLDFTKIEMGYEDNNYVLATEKGKSFVKIFGNYRDLPECQRYISILEKVQEAGVSTPKLLQKDGSALYSYENANLAVFECVEGKTFYELDRLPTEEEARQIIAEAAKINQLDYDPGFVYDDWAIVNVLEEYPKMEKCLSEEEKARVAPLIEQYKNLDLETLPKCLVHGDLISTNVMIDDAGKISIIDFACSNHVPRIIELAVMGCNLLSGFEPSFILDEYGKHAALTEEERRLFPLFLELAHTMHFISAVRERDMYGNTSAENDYWLNQGKGGLGIRTDNV